MTTHKDLKKLIRARMARTGESYSTARMHVLTEHAGPPPEAAADDGPREIEAAVLKLNDRSARVRVLGASEHVTLRSTDVHRAAPGQIVTARIARWWTYCGDRYATGSISDVRTDVAALGLEPLPLVPQGMLDPEDHLDESGEATPASEAIGPRSRPAFEMHPIAWEGRAAHESDDPDEAPVSEAAEEHARGERALAHEIVMDVLCDDLRCVDAHAHLGNWAFDASPRRALAHYEIGLGIADLSLVGAPADAVFPYGYLYNRPLFRALHGAALAHWRMADLEAAERTAVRALSLDPLDAIGFEEILAGLRRGMPWKAWSVERGGG